MEYLKNLNASQRKAVTAPLGPVSVIAGPGSGKTRVLTARIQHLFYNYHCAPTRIRAVTFTQSGTQTMRQRLEDSGVKNVRISTFHSLCRSIINDYYQRVPELVDFCQVAGVEMPFCWHSLQRKENQPHLDWYETDGHLTLDLAYFIAFQYACVAFFEQTEPILDFTPEGYKRIDDAFQDIKQQLNPINGFIGVKSPELTLLANFQALRRFRHYVHDIFGYELRIAEELHPDYREMVAEFSDCDPQLEIFFSQAYNQLVAQYVFLDFTEQILWAHHILKNSPDALRGMQNQYDALLIDEFQDTDPVQFDIARDIVATHQNLFVVGDHNQAIYGFRGADARNIYRFRDAFTHVHEVLLDTNYRSTPEIVEVSRAVVETYQDPNYVFPTAVKPSGAIIKTVNQLTDVEISDPAEVLVLSYTNRKVNENCFTLKKMGIPYMKTVRFAEGGEKKVFCISKKIVNRILDVMAFLQEPTREHILKAAAHVNRIGKTALAYLEKSDDLIAEDQLTELFHFRETTEPLTLQSQVQNIGERSGRTTDGQHGIFTADTVKWREDGTRANVAFLGRILARYGCIPTYEDLLIASAEVMTVHQAKGMEAPVVIVDGYSFFRHRGPEVQSPKTVAESVYEMARVMYVALSRAERELYLVTDFRDFPNMQAVYAAIDRQAEIGSAVDVFMSKKNSDFSVEDARAFAQRFGGDV